MGAKTKPAKHTREFFCVTCNPDTEAASMSGPEMIEHLRTVHNIVNGKGTKSLRMALDGADFYHNSFTWTMAAPDGAPVKLIEETSGPRSKHF